ncbi:hypothetical protein [Marinifilum fragile]|uniref:hypothetical protein n=1 Tax=Marinifilum fragile TaxID=570161 RepID=UPI002AA8ABA3|nr:hypothetical protein [Marinifilum fragile]
MERKVFFCVVCLFIFCGCKPYWERGLYPLELNGVVENTFIDYKDHAIRVVVVKEQNELKEFYVWKDYSYEFYNNIQKGDSIFKSANTLEFYLKKDGKKRKYQFEKYP